MTSNSPINFNIIKNQLWKEHLDEVQKYTSSPTLLPEYQKEYLSFVCKRTIVIKKLGGNPETYDFKSEFEIIWGNKFKSIMNSKFEQKIKLGQKYFSDGSQPKDAYVIISKVYNDMANHCKSMSPLSFKRDSSDSSSRSSKYRSYSSRRNRHRPKVSSVHKSHKHYNRASRRSESSDASVASDFMSSPDGERSHSSKDRVDSKRFSSESRYYSKSRSKDHFDSTKNISVYPRSRSTSKKKKSKRKHRKRSRSKSYFDNHLDTKKYKYKKKGKSYSHSRSKSSSISRNETKYNTDSRGEINTTHNSTNISKKSKGKDYISGSLSSSSSHNKGRRSQFHSSPKNIKCERKFARSPSQNRSESNLSSSDADRPCMSCSTNFRNQREALLPNFSSEISSKDEIQNFFQSYAKYKVEPLENVKISKKSSNPASMGNEPIDVLSSFSKLKFNKFLQLCSANLHLKQLSSPTDAEKANQQANSLKAEIDLFLKNAAVKESMLSVNEKESSYSKGLSPLLKKIDLDSYVDEITLNTKQDKVSFTPKNFNISGVSKLHLLKESVNTSSCSNNDIQNDLSNLDSDDEKIPIKETTQKNIEDLDTYELRKNTLIKTKSSAISQPLDQISTLVTPESIQKSIIENIFFTVYKETLIYLKNHENLLGIYSSVIGPLLLDLCSTYSRELNLDHRLALDLILDMLRLNLCDKTYGATERQFYKEAISKIENILLTYTSDDVDYDSYPSFLYGYDVNDLANKMLKLSSLETKKFIDCLLLHDGFQHTDLEPFVNLYEKVEMKKQKLNQIKNGL